MNINNGKFYVKNWNTGGFLNKNGGWFESINSYGLATFTSEAAAKAAFPKGVECVAISIGKSEDAKVESDCKFVIQLETKILCKDDQLKSIRTTKRKDPDVQLFDSEDAAVNKADSLKLPLDKIEVKSLKLSIDKIEEKKIDQHKLSVSIILFKESNYAVIILRSISIQ